MIDVQIAFVDDLMTKPDPADSSPAMPALLYEMMRSFVALARTLNLSQAVEALGSTRQTVRRHIAQLEQAMGLSLFEVEQRRLSYEDHSFCAKQEPQISILKC